MKHTYPEDDESIGNAYRQFVKDTAAMELMNYTLPTFLPRNVEPLLANHIFAKLVRRWHVRRLPEIAAEGNFEMIVCPYCCETVTLESCRIDHVIPWGKLVLYRVIKELYQRIDEKDSLNEEPRKSRLSDKTKAEKVFSKVDVNKQEYDQLSKYKSKKTVRKEDFPNSVLPEYGEIKWAELKKNTYTDEQNLLLCCHRCNIQKSDSLIDSGHLEKYIASLGAAVSDGKINAETENKITEKIKFLTKNLDEINNLHHAIFAFVDGEYNGRKLLDNIKKDIPEIPSTYNKGYGDIYKINKIDAPVNEFRKKFNTSIEWGGGRPDLQKWQDGIVAIFLAQHSVVISDLLSKRPGNTDGQEIKPDTRSSDEVLSDFISKHPKASEIKEFRAKLEPVNAVNYLSEHARDISKREPLKLRLINTQLAERGPHVLRGRICFYCFGIYEDFAFEIDHIKPVLRVHGFITVTSGDKLKAENYLPVCKTCNASKNSSRLSVLLLQRLMLKRWLDVRAPGLEHASYVSEATETDECDEIESVFSTEIKRVIAVKRDKLLLPEKASTGDLYLMDHQVGGDEAI